MDAARVPTHRRVVHVMGTAVSSALRGEHAAGFLADAAWEAVVAELRGVDAAFSRYRPGSWISLLRAGRVTRRQCPPVVRDVLALADVARERTDGWFDVWRLDPDGVRRLDTDGLVKGWAVQRAFEHLRRLPGTDACLAAGGDVVCRSVSGTPWRIGVEDPHDLSQLLTALELHDGAVATSGRAWRGDHVVDPRTGLPSRRLAQVTVVARELTWGDVDATAALAMAGGAAAWLEGRGTSAVLVDDEGVRSGTGDLRRGLARV